MATKAEKLLAKGQTFEKKGKLDKALEAYRDACQDSPYDPELWTARAELAVKLGHASEAADSLFRVGDLFARGGMPSEALKVIRRVLELDSQHSGARRLARMLESRVEAPEAPEPPAADPEPMPAPEPDSVPVFVSAPAPEPDPVPVFVSAPAPEPDPVPVFVSAPEPAPEPASVQVPVAAATTAAEIDAPPGETIFIEADEPEPMDVFRKPAAASAAPSVTHLPSTAVTADELPLAMTAAAAGRGTAVTPGSGSGHANGNAATATRPTASHTVASAEFAMGTTTGEMALDSLSLGERLAAASSSARASDIPLDDEPRLDVVQAVASTLSTSPLLSELDSDLVKMLVECGALVHRAEGENVFRQGEGGTSLFLILRGEVAVIRETLAGETGGARELARLRAGAFFGEMAVLTNAPRSATVRALSIVDLLEISRRDLRLMIDREARVLKLLMRFFRARMVGTLLQTSPLFKLFGREEKRALVSRFRLRELGPGYDVLEEGTRSDGLFMVLAGKLEAARGPAVLGLLGPGDIFGEMSLLENSTAMATVRAKTRAWVLILPRADFMALTARHPGIVDHLNQLADERRARNQAKLTAEPVSEVSEDRLVPV